MNMFQQGVAVLGHIQDFCANRPLRELNYLYRLASLLGSCLFEKENVFT